MNLCCFVLTLGESCLRTYESSELILVIKLVNYIKTRTAAAKINIHILPKSARAKWWSKISIFFNKTIGDVPWESRIYTLNTILIL